MEDPIITDCTAMTRAETRFSAQAYGVLVLTCRRKALQVVQQVPRGLGFEAWRQQHKEFEPHPPVKSKDMRQALIDANEVRGVGADSPPEGERAEGLRGAAG